MKQAFKTEEESTGFPMAKDSIQKKKKNLSFSPSAHAASRHRGVPSSCERQKHTGLFLGGQFSQFLHFALLDRCGHRVNFGEDIRRRLIHTAQARRGVFSSVAVNPVPCFIQTSLSIGTAGRLLSRRNGEKFTSDGLGRKKDGPRCD